MKADVAFFAVVLSIATAGCSGNGSHLAVPTPNKESAKTADIVRALVTSYEKKLPAGTRIYITDSLVVRSGDEFAQFAAAARVTRTAVAVTVHDIQSGQSFTFPPTASIEYTSGTSRAYVLPHTNVPQWVSLSHGRAERTL